MEDLADYFAKITEEFLPLGHSEIPFTYDREVQDLNPTGIVERLIDMKKPKSSVIIDPLSRFVQMHAALFACPLARIINNIRAGGSWPKLWAEEEVSVIPKGANANSYASCRNISCISIFSKLTESYMLDDLNNEVSLSTSQYGAQKGSGPPRMLVDLMTKSLEQLDDNQAAVSVILIDFEKAFNRMHHQACLFALASKGASNQTLSTVVAFLSGRSMRIKIGRTLSTPRATPGGAPQGTKAGNFLFCVTVDGIDKEDYLERVMPNVHATRTNDKEATPDQEPVRTSPELAAVPPQEIARQSSLASSISRYGMPESPHDCFSLCEIDF